MAMQYEAVASPQANPQTLMTYGASASNGNIFAAFKAAPSTTPSLVQVKNTIDDSTTAYTSFSVNITATRRCLRE